MNNFIITIRGLEGNDPYTVKVSEQSAKGIKRAMDSKGSTYVGNEFLPYTRILSITEDITDIVRLDKPRCKVCDGLFWVKCEKCGDYNACICRPDLKEKQVQIIANERILSNEIGDNKPKPEGELS